MRQRGPYLNPPEVPLSESPCDTTAGRHAPLVYASLLDEHHHQRKLGHGMNDLTSTYLTSDKEPPLVLRTHTRMT